MSTVGDMSDAPTVLLWREPWRDGGLLTVARNPQLLWQFAQNELRFRYRGTFLGGAWGYMRPLTRFVVYFVVIGVLLGLTRRVPNFPVYIFCGVLVVQYFTTSLTTGTRSLARYGAVLRRVSVPREMLPLASVVASFVRLRQSAIILAIATILTGWRPVHLSAIPYAIGGLLLLTVFVSGLVMVSSVANLYVRDTQHAVETIVMLAPWASPVIYPWTLVPDRFGDGLITTLYLSNPVTVAMFGVREAFWEPTLSESLSDTALPPMPLTPVLLSIAISVALFVCGAWLMRTTGHRALARAYEG